MVKFSPIQQVAYRLGQAHGVLGYGAIPGADIPTALVQRYMPKAWPYARGMSSRLVGVLSPWAMGASAAYTWETSGARERFTDVVTGQPREGSHWENTPKQKFNARLTHGFFVSPKDRMTRNTPLPYGQAFLDSERRYS